MGYTRNIGHNLLTQVLKIVLGVLTGILVARALGPAGQGFAAYILLVFGILGTFGHFGIISAVTYFQKRSGFDRSAIYSTNLNLLVLISLFLAAIVLILRGQRLILGDYHLIYILGGILLMAGTLITTHHQAWLIGDEQIILNNRIGLGIFFFKSLSILVLWILGRLSPLSFFSLSVLAMLLWTLLIQIRLKEQWLPVISTNVLKAEFSYGTLAWMAALFAYLHYRVDQVMIKQFLGIAELGVYSIAVQIAELVFLLPVAINSALTGRLYNLEPGSDGRQILSRTIRISFWICGALVVAGLLGSLLIPFVYGQAYSGAVSVMMILMPGVLFACLPKIASPWWFTSGRPRVHLNITFFTLLLNIALNFLMIPKWGINGAALASSISYFAYGLYYIILLVSREGFKTRELFALQAADLKQAKELLHR